MLFIAAYSLKLGPKKDSVNVFMVLIFRFIWVPSNL